ATALARAWGDRTDEGTPSRARSGPVSVAGSPKQRFLRPSFARSVAGRPNPSESDRQVALRRADVANVGADQAVVRGLLEDVGRPRVVGAVDAVAEAHQPLAAVERSAQPRLGPLDRAHLRQLVDDLGRGAAVEWPFHRPDRATDGRGDVGVRRGDDPGGKGRRVEAVLGPDDEIGVEGARIAGVGRLTLELVEEAGDEVE